MSLFSQLVKDNKKFQCGNTWTKEEHIFYNDNDESINYKEDNGGEYFGFCPAMVWFITVFLPEFSVFGFIIEIIMGL